MSSPTSNRKLKKKKYFDNEDNEENGFVQKRNKKKKKVKQVVEEASDDGGEEHSMTEEVVQPSPTKTIKEEPEEETWSKEDCKELIRRMESQIPENDNKSFGSRIVKLDWSQIQFGSHSIEDCHEKWMFLRGKVRHYRLLSEVLNDAKEWVDNPWVTPFNKLKKVRHPERPVRPMSSFMLYYMDKKKKFIKKYPNLKLTDVTKLVAAKYKAASDEKKAIYVERAKLIQEEYKQNLSKFYEKYPELMTTSKKQAAKSNRPLPPFKLFLKKKISKHQDDEGFNQHDFTEKCKEAWKTLSSKRKGYWIRLAKEEEDKYLEQCHEEDDDSDNKLASSYKSVISKEEYAILDRLAGKPEKPPNSAYSLFSRLMLQDKDRKYVDGEPKNRMREIAIKWKELPEEQKKNYAENVQQMHEQYKLEFANYLDNLPEDKKKEELAKLQPKKKPTKLKKKTEKKSAQYPKKEGVFSREPEKPPVTAWDLFKNEFVKKHSHLSSKDAYKQAATMWKSMTPKETGKYIKKYEHLKDKYLEDYEAFLQTLTEEELKIYSASKTSAQKSESNEDSFDEMSSDEDDSDESSSASSQLSDSGVSEEES